MVMNNKKGMMIILKIMIAILILIMVMIMIPPLRQSIDYGTNTSEYLNCSVINNTAVTVATCTVLDFSFFWIIGAAISVGMAFIAGKKNINGVVTAIVVFVILTVLISPLKTLIILVRDADHLACASSGISVATKLSCIFMDLWLFWFFVAALSAAVTYEYITRISPPGEGLIE